MTSRTYLIAIGVVVCMVIAGVALGLWYYYSHSDEDGGASGLYARLGKDAFSSQNCMVLFALDYVNKKFMSGDAKTAYSTALQQISKNSQCSVACIDPSIPWVDLSEKACADSVGPASGLDDGSITCEKLGAALKSAVHSGACKVIS
jgi:hypothetical protein